MLSSCQTVGTFCTKSDAYIPKKAAIVQGRVVGEHGFPTRDLSLWKTMSNIQCMPKQYQSTPQCMGSVDISV